ncbi:MAG TPA: HAD family hydrolase [Frankiaceae bacterium]|nr:HAD family hydrolase [Frankiaceae bacterium]
MIRAVFFDVGETLVCEDAVWRAWAEVYGVPPLTFMGALGAVIERRAHHKDVFRYFGSDPESIGESPHAIGPADLYPDAVPCLRALKAAGYLVGVSGNQPPDVSERLMASLGLDLDVVASSAAWGVEKPDPAFFARVAAAAGLPVSEIAYVGDRVDNDVLPAKAAGMTAVFLRRGPWGYVHAAWPEAASADVRIDSLAELPDALSARTDI